MKIKMNLPVRFQNPWFWVGLVSVIFSAMGADPAMFTSWDLLATAFQQLFGNPYMLGCVLLAILSVFVDPTTKGLSDSPRALEYKKPE